MPYWQIVMRSFRIAWDHKYLWLLALFSGEAGYGFNYSPQTSTTRNVNPPNASTIRDQVTTWLGNHITLIVALAIIWLVLLIAFFVLAAVCEGATVRASAEHDAERPFGIGQAWRTGVHTMWVMVRFRLMLFLLALPLLLFVAAWAIGLVVAIVNQNAVAIVPLVFSGLLLALVWLVYGTYLFFLDRLGTRALVLEELMALPAIARAHRLLFKRLGRTLLVWLLSIGVGIAIAIAAACAAALVVAPFAIAAGFAGSSNSAAGVAVGALVAVIFVPVFLVITGFFAAQSSTYWTLAFRRLDIDYAPAYGYPVAPATPPSPQG
jgi:hypothetical protein